MKEHYIGNRNRQGRLFNYTLTNKEGDILDTSVGVEPLHYIHGDGTLIKGLEMALGGRKKGTSFK